MSISSSGTSLKDVKVRPVIPGRVQQSRLPSFNAADGDKTVQIILRDLEKCKRLKKDRRRLLPKCEDLVNFIVLQVRKKASDHLLQATIVWALINILRFEPQAMKDIMINAGVPGMMYTILSSDQLRGATRTYASELCFYVCSNERYENKASLNRIKAAMADLDSQGSTIATGSVGQFLPGGKGASGGGKGGRVSRLPSTDHSVSSGLVYDADNNRMRGDDMASVGAGNCISYAYLIRPDTLIYKPSSDDQCPSPCLPLHNRNHTQTNTHIPSHIHHSASFLPWDSSGFLLRPPPRPSRQTPSSAV
jgi:hypothetical protein